jgi:hypothetical protein
MAFAWYVCSVAMNHAISCSTDGIFTDRLTVCLFFVFIPDFDAAMEMIVMALHFCICSHK